MRVHPVIFRIGNVEFYSYGLMLGLGYVAGVLVASWMARKRGIDPDSLFWFFVLLLVAGVAGGRIAYVALYPWYYRDGLLSALNIRDGGLSMHGVLAGGIAAVAAYAKTKKIPMPRLLDIIAPGIIIGQSIGRIGCYLNGCCYGIPTEGTWGCMTRYAPLLRHPYQLYESGADFLIFLGLLWLSSRVKREGDLFLAYLGSYSFARFFLEFFRDNESYVFGLSYGQVASAALVVLSLVLAFIGKRQARVAENPEMMAQEVPGRDRDGQLG
ncbi:MAG: prolipoprotein diacylglyceryl transferase [Firmicutes bacterium]|nr:prolipoprotein diacylglyceryl transferase [Candidatus Fermentithermobacillaceae bacterium]